MTTFWCGRKVLVTGHTGFKGSWLCELLLNRGALVSGLALPPETSPALFDQLGLARRVTHQIGDIRNPERVLNYIDQNKPEIIFHLAAQPLVRRSYRDPLETWSTNVMGTANVLEAVRLIGLECAVVVITTDKVYANCEWEHPYRETDTLGGHDPYSASKAGTELVASSYRNAFFRNGPIRLATARAGNVIGGGDWSEDRIIPDLARAFGAGNELLVRNSHAIRPWQHVLDPLEGYLILAEKLAGTDWRRFADSFNFGPETADMRSVGALVEAACESWAGSWSDKTDPDAPHEAGILALSIERARKTLGWQPKWDFIRAVRETAVWYRDVSNGADPAAIVRSQIEIFSGQQ